MPADHVHFNGSVNLADAESVMREIASRVPSGLRRIPDGETGDRGNWIFFQLQKFLQLPWLVPDRPVGEADGEYEQLPRLRLAEGADPGQVTWPDLGYADAYQESYRVFAGLRDEGVIPAGVRFQVQTQHRWPRSTPTSSRSSGRRCRPRTSGRRPPTWTGCWPRSRPTRWPATGRRGGVRRAGERVRAGRRGGVRRDHRRAGRARGPGARRHPAGLHLCYGDYGHPHFKQPSSLALQVRVLNAVTAAAQQGELRLVHRAAVPARRGLLRAPGRAGRRPAPS